MEGQDYLNQISASNRPVKTSKGLGGILSSKFLWIGVIGVAAFIMIAMVGSMLGGGKNSEKELVLGLKTHANNTAEVMREYQQFIKSSDLRSSSASLVGVLSNMGTGLDTFIAENYGEVKLTEKQTAEADEAKEALTNDLFEAKINGILDRIYAHKMAYEISLFVNEEANIYDSTKNDRLKEILDESYGSLEILYSKFNDFSETK